MAMPSWYLKTALLICSPAICISFPPYQLIEHRAHSKLQFMWTHFQASIDDDLDFFMLLAGPA